MQNYRSVRTHSDKVNYLDQAGLISLIRNFLKQVPDKGTSLSFLSVIQV